MKQDFLLCIAFFFMSCVFDKESGSNDQTLETADKFIDSRDGKVYKKAIIGTQTWMAENLAYLPQVDAVADGSEDISCGKYYYIYGYTPSGATEAEQVSNAKADSNYQTYGVLYNWNAAMNGTPSSSASPSGVQGACPPGWHLPSDAEWKTLEMYLGMSQSEADSTGFRGTTEGKKLKAASFGGTDDFGFSALPAAYRYHNDSFHNLGFRTYFWAATEYDATFAWDRALLSNHDDVARHTIAYKNLGFSVRCLEGGE